MKAALCVLLLATAVVSGAEEKKNEKRGVLGLGYGGLGYGGLSAPLVSHGYYGHGLGLYGGHGLGYYGGHGLGYYGGHSLPYYGGHGAYGGGLYGHSLPVAAPLVSHSTYSAPLLGLGHGWH